ncbi:hypothetical protein JZ785_19895 [Alicyclobacillus curvatus]|nr:hypothetical protein JZ785_19895 [Alicyclobacillus curvatus]
MDYRFGKVTWMQNPKEIEAVMKLPAPQRYEYFMHEQMTSASGDFGQDSTVRHEALCTEATNSGGWRVPHLAKARMACVGSEQTQGLKPIQQCSREGEPTSQDAGLASTTCYGQRKQSHV